MFNAGQSEWRMCSIACVSNTVYDVAKDAVTTRWTHILSPFTMRLLEWHAMGKMNAKNPLKWSFNWITDISLGVLCTWSTSATAAAATNSTTATIAATAWTTRRAAVPRSTSNRFTRIRFTATGRMWQSAVWSYYWRRWNENQRIPLDGTHSIHQT